MAYSDGEKHEALIRLFMNRFDYKKTAEQLGMSPRTLKNWERDLPKFGVPDYLERAIERMLTHIPTEWKGNDWGVVLGILLDKWLLLQGQPTERTETTSIQKIMDELKSVPTEELEGLYDSFISHARHAKSGSNSTDKE